MSDSLIRVKVTAGARIEGVEEIESGVLKVKVNQVAEKGKANIRVAQLLAEHFSTPITRVFLKSGATSREKVFLISNN